MNTELDMFDVKDRIESILKEKDDKMLRIKLKNYLDELREDIADAGYCPNCESEVISERTIEGTMLRCPECGWHTY